ncbi:lanthionine synthetase C family protein [Lentzea sp. NPDC102401]|uniref:lanthionine synthetase C family protein n=1 Tax=Lentzea sp. NPDC102401 TaxID=3364128 RepID=UPI0038038FE0
MNLVDLHTPPPPSSPDWGQSLASGAAGITLLHLEHVHTGTGQWNTARTWVRAMTQQKVTANPDTAGLFHGAPAIAFTLHSARQPAYAQYLRTLDDHLTAITVHRLHAAHDRIDRGLLPRLREFDLISGLTGLGAVLLHLNNQTDVLQDVLAYLVRLTEPLTANGEQLPGWWSSDGPTGLASSDWPGGHANLGIAHGISGPLALLATAHRHGVTVPGQTESIGYLLDWLDKWRVGAGRTAWWPGMISRAEYHAKATQVSEPQRPSWCYGTPGLARAQQLGAIALDDQARQRAAESALAGCVTDQRQLALLNDASLCHGWAGLVHVTRRAAANAFDDSLSALLQVLDAHLQTYLRLYGTPDEPGLLTGAAGVLLAQHASTTNAVPVTQWDASLLLAG